VSNPYVILGLAALSFSLGQSGPLILRGPGVLRFAWGLLLHAALFVSERAVWALFAWLLGTAATDFVASFGDLFAIIGRGSLPLLFAAIAFAPHLGPPFMGIFYVVSFFDVTGRASAQFAVRPVATALWLGITWLAALLAVWAVRRVVRELSVRTRLDPLRDVRPYTTAEILATMPGVQSRAERKAPIQR
jgi:hypothetical protein